MMLHGIQVVGWEAVGSRVTCNPPPTDTDEDFLCLVDCLGDFVQDAQREGFDFNGSLIDENDTLTRHFASVRKGDINLIGTTEKKFYDKFLLASKVAKSLNLLNKSDRIILFQAILYG